LRIFEILEKLQKSKECQLRYSEINFINFKNFTVENEKQIIEKDLRRVSENLSIKGLRYIKMDYLAGADWPLWQCGNCHEAFVKNVKKEAFKEF
jgi:hypothetical protein